MSVQEQLERVREIMEDENRIVTYKLLSKELKISVNDAKSVLERFVKQERDKKRDGFVICYCVSGLKNLKLDDQERQVNVVCVVPDKKLETLKSSLKLVSSEHVYSVQKGAQNSCSLYATDLDVIDERHLSSAVKCDKVKPRVGQPKNAVAETQNKINAVKVAPKLSKDKASATEDVTDSVRKANPPNPKSDERNGIAKGNNTGKAKSGAKENKTTLANMFANQTAKEKVMKSKEKENLNSPVKESNCVVGKKANAEVAAKEKVKSDEPVVQKKASTNKRPTTRGRKNVRSKSKTKSGEAPPKRRRILVSDSSSSESEEEEDPLAALEMDEPEDPVPSVIRSPSPNSLKSRTNGTEDMDVDESPPSESPGIVRERKLVSKTFMDEDGYLVTKKVMEITERVEDPLPPPKHNDDSNKTNGKSNRKENSVAAKKSSVNSKSKKPTPPKNNKQSSLMSFFKKA